MDLDDQTVGAGSHGGERERRHVRRLPGPVARVDDDRQMRDLVHDRDGRHVEDVARRGLAATDGQAALAQHHVRVPLAQDVFGTEHPVLDGRVHPAALEQDRMPGAPDLAEQRVVLHVARADLQDVDVLRAQGDVVRIQHL